MHIVVDLFAIYSKLPMGKNKHYKTNKVFILKYCFSFERINNNNKKKIKMLNMENTIQNKMEYIKQNKNVYIKFKIGAIY